MGSCTMMLVLLQVFFLFASAAASASGPPISPPTTQTGDGLNPRNVKEWLDDPKNMAILWGLAKQSLLVLPPPKNLDELEYFLITINKVVSQKVALLKLLINGGHPEVARRLQRIGPNPDPGVLMRLLNANSAPHLHQLLKREGY